MITLIKHPTRRGGLTIAAVLSLAVHAAAVVIVYTYPIIQIVLGFNRLEYVDEAYDKTILIDFTKKLSYPSGYLGFRPPVKTKSLEEIKKEEERRRRLATARRERLEREREEIAPREAEEKRTAEQLAKAAPTPTPAPKNDGYPGGFGKINTAPIKDQIQRLYEAKKEGKLEIPEGKLRVGVSGVIKGDGTLTDYRIIVPSGVKEIDRAALAILEAVSASRALGPLQNLTSLSMILDVNHEVAQLNVVGFTASDQEARAIVDLANTALLFARIKKSGDPAAMIMLNNLKVSRTGQRVQAVISVPRQAATETLAKTVGKGQG